MGSAAAVTNATQSLVAGSVAALGSRKGSTPGERPVPGQQVRGARDATTSLAWRKSSWPRNLLLPRPRPPRRTLPTAPPTSGINYLHLKQRRKPRSGRSFGMHYTLSCLLLLYFVLIVAHRRHLPFSFRSMARSGAWRLRRRKGSPSRRGPWRRMDLPPPKEGGPLQSVVAAAARLSGHGSTP